MNNPTTSVPWIKSWDVLKVQSRIMGTIFFRVQLCNRTFLYRHWWDFRLLYKEIETLYFPEFIETRNYNTYCFLTRMLKSSGLYVNIQGAFRIQPWCHLWVIFVNPKYWRVQETIFKSNFSTLHSRPSWSPKHLRRTTDSPVPNSSLPIPFPNNCLSNDIDRCFSDCRT